MDKPQPLTGEALLAKFQELGHLSYKEKAKACGYYTVTKNGLERVNIQKFRNALIEAYGIELDGKGRKPKRSRGGREASYRVRVQSNGNLLIGAAYTKQMNLKPGDEFEISLGRKQIRLTQVTPANRQ
ncbi:MAG: AbrB family transcriptional regulator [Gloeomargarita sp. SKYG116]|nr:AbrB family transcriptional regulator [Gloeomargarita sp. SKYG116]MCS7226264.1 AbrB family transcriptional regulator [Gloeomargarita sp. SKYB31]MDW8400569.1 AbrB family transcriptional regulator [Gloeomargarita sp. SKYGB_i_bin116]